MLTESGHIRDDREQVSSLQRNHWSAATLKVLSSMPSRTAGEMMFLITFAKVVSRQYNFPVALENKTQANVLRITGA